LIGDREVTQLEHEHEGLGQPGAHRRR
jgi:hypothetical protein